jgi:hypothetical protein
MAQHTPAPWICTIGNEERNPDVMQQGTFASIASLSGMAPHDEMQANARLIAAAPELLMRLDDLCHGLEGLDLPGALPARLKKALAAIAKATGA